MAQGQYHRVHVGQDGLAKKKEGRKGSERDRIPVSSGLFGCFDSFDLVILQGIASRKSAQTRWLSNNFGLSWVTRKSSIIIHNHHHYPLELECPQGGAPVC